LSRLPDHLRLVHDPQSGHDFSTTPPNLPSPTSEIETDVNSTKPFAYHLWESVAWETYLQHYTPENVVAKSVSPEALTSKEGVSRPIELQGDNTRENQDEMEARSSFARLAAEYVTLELIQDWRGARSNGIIS
jgi:hypothetical protein